MAFVHGKGTVISVGGDDMSAFGTSCEFVIKADAHDVTTFGQTAKVFSGGLTESSLKLSGTYDDTATGPRGVLEPLVGTTTEVVYQPEGVGAGNPTRTLDAVLVSYTESAAVADMIKYEAEFTGSGAVATTTA